MLFSEYHRKNNENIDHHGHPTDFQLALMNIVEEHVIMVAMDKTSSLAIALKDWIHVMACCLFRGKPLPELWNDDLLTDVYMRFPSVLTHWGRDEMDKISQTAFSNICSLMKMFEFISKFHFSELMVVILSTHTCVTQPQWVRYDFVKMQHFAVTKFMFEIYILWPPKYIPGCVNLVSWLQNAIYF